MKIQKPIRSWAFAGIGLALLGCVESVTTWREVTTPHFRISTNVEEARARELATQLEQTRAALLSAAWRDAKEPAGSTDVVVFRQAAGLDAECGENDR